MSASSSEVRSASVAMRQWSTRSMRRVEQPDDRLRVSGVDREQHQASASSADVEADVEHAHRVRERADRDEIGAALRVGADRVEA